MKRCCCFRSRPITGTGLGTYNEVTYRLEGNTAEPVFRRQRLACAQRLPAPPGGNWNARPAGVVLLLVAIIARLLGAWKQADARYGLYAAGALWAVLAFLVLSISEVLIGARVTPAYA